MTTEPTPTAPPGEKPRFLDKPGNVKTLLWLFLGVCAAVVLYEFLRPLGAGGGGGEEAHDLAERAPALAFIGSFAIYGFVSCVVLILLGKGLRRLAMRPEDYYGDGDDSPATADGEENSPDGPN